MRKKIGLKIKWLLMDLLAIFGYRPSFKSVKGEVRTLVFHGVCGNEEPMINGRFIRVGDLESLLESLVEHVKVLSIKEFEANAIDPSRLNVMFTFDDGYKNNRDLVLPLFEKYQVPYLIYCNSVSFHLMDLLDISYHFQPELMGDFLTHFQITTPVHGVKEFCKRQPPKNVRKMREYLWNNLSTEVKEHSKKYWELLADEDILFLSKSRFVHFGNHGGEHLFYPTLGEEELIRDMEMVENRFKRLSVEFTSFAFPYGATDDFVGEVVRRKGYDLQFSDHYLKRDYGNAKQRITINPFISVRNQLAAIIKGKY